MTTRKRTTTKRTKRATSNKYKNYTPAKLIASAHKWQKKWVAFSKTAAKKKINGKTIAAHKTAVQKEMKRIAANLSSATTKQIKDKIKLLKKQMAKHHNVKTTSRKATSPAVKRLTLKYKQFKKSGGDILSLIKLHSGLKLSSFKNPIGKKKAKKTKSSTTGTRKKTTTKTTTKRTTGVKKTTAKRRATAKKGVVKAKRAIATKAVTTKYKTQTKSLKKEISKLKQRNVAMKKLVVKFRKEVAQLQRHYGALNSNKPRLKLVHSKKVGQDVTNIVRFSNALSNAFTKQPQRKVG